MVADFYDRSRANWAAWRRRTVCRGLKVLKPETLEASQLQIGDDDLVAVGGGKGLGEVWAFALQGTRAAKLVVTSNFSIIRCLKLMFELACLFKLHASTISDIVYNTCTATCRNSCFFFFWGGGGGGSEASSR